MTGHKQGADRHTRNYARNPPIQGLLQRAGGDLFKPKDYHPIVFQTDPMEDKLLEELCEQMIPEFVKQYDELCTKFNRAKSHTHRKLERLSTRRGVVRWMIYCVKHCFLMLAAPLVDPETYRLTSDHESLWEKMKHQDLSCILMLEPFKSPQFAELQKLVLSKMKRANKIACEYPRDPENALEKIVIEHVAKPLNLLFQQHNAQMAKFEQRLDIIQQVSAGRVALPHNKHEPLPPSTPATPTATGRLGVSCVTPLTNQSPTIESPGLKADGTARKRRRKVTQAENMSTEYKR